ncbi:hypothetical protein EDB81DRAFT_129491 [Dactylonectria macrodidyma]|uniref:Uncharacterized protein n=1 Tax=Dactylonectria macrodidyma TaxID=307937 RepID=A0A9P9E2T8_9HYPO|nr:hypothetical protein EDB81DRAFT_129491 [Dactylonectria macrodidyma]
MEYGRPVWNMEYGVWNIPYSITYSIRVWIESLDAPNFHIGNGLNLATTSLVLIVGLLVLFWMKWDNKRREDRSVEEEIAGMSQEEIQDLDWKHPAFRWRP